MNVTFPSVRIGEPIRHQRLAAFPLFIEAPSPVDYDLAADAIAAGHLVVEEVSEAGSVPNLSVTNKSDSPVLFLEGEQLIGAKQNRIANTSILVAARTNTSIPVSCVEQGRWRFKARHFASAGGHSPSKLRYALKMSVNDSVRNSGGHRSDQGKIWKEVAAHLKAHGVSSATSAMEDAFESHRNKLSDLQERFAYAEGAAGVAIALGNRIVCLDLFDKPATCRKVWERLLSGMLLEAESPTDGAPQATEAEVQNFLADLAAAPWESAAAAGEGQEFRATTNRRTQASFLRVDERLVHTSAVAAEAAS